MTFVAHFVLKAGDWLYLLLYNLILFGPTMVLRSPWYLSQNMDLQVFCVRVKPERWVEPRRAGKPAIPIFS